MSNQNIVFHSSASNLEAMMDACFPRQHKAHVEAYRYHQEKLTRAARNAAIDAHLMQAYKELHDAR
jgi:hypothetical protein